MDGMLTDERMEDSKMQMELKDRVPAYLAGVMDRACHHAPQVRVVVPALAGYILAYADPDAPIMVRSRIDATQTANQVWALFNGQRISFSYRHSTGQIEARKGATVLEVFDNRTQLLRLHLFFTGLTWRASAQAA